MPPWSGDVYILEAVMCSPKEVTGELGVCEQVGMKKWVEAPGLVLSTSPSRLTGERVRPETGELSEDHTVTEA